MVIVLVSTPSEVCDQTMNNLKLTWKSFPSSPLHEQSIIPYILCSSYKLLLFKLPPTLMLPKSIQIKSECPCIPSGLGIFLWELNYEVGFWGALPRSISNGKEIHAHLPEGFPVQKQSYLLATEQLLWCCWRSTALLNGPTAMVIREGHEMFFQLSPCQIYAAGFGEIAMF